MADPPVAHPVYRSINRPLTIWGIDRRLFLLVLMLGAAMFNFFGSLLGGLVMGVAGYVAARAATRRDPQLLRILLNSSRVRRLYDPGKFQPCARRQVVPRA